MSREEEERAREAVRRAQEGLLRGAPAPEVVQGYFVAQPVDDWKPLAVLLRDYIVQRDSGLFTAATWPPRGMGFRPQDGSGAILGAIRRAGLPMRPSPYAADPSTPRRISNDLVATDWEDADSDLDERDSICPTCGAYWECDCD